MNNIYIYKYITCQLKYDFNNNKQFYNKIIYIIN